MAIRMPIPSCRGNSAAIRPSTAKKTANTGENCGEISRLEKPEMRLRSQSSRGNLNQWGKAPHLARGQESTDIPQMTCPAGEKRSAVLLVFLGRS